MPLVEEGKSKIYTRPVGRHTLPLRSRRGHTTLRRRTPPSASPLPRSPTPPAPLAPPPCSARIPCPSLARSRRPHADSECPPPASWRRPRPHSESDCPPRAAAPPPHPRRRRRPPCPSHPSRIIPRAREHLLREGHASAVAAPMVRDTRRVVSISPAVLASREPHAASQRVRLPRSLLRNEPQYPTKGYAPHSLGC